MTVTRRQDAKEAARREASRARDTDVVCLALTDYAFAARQHKATAPEARQALLLLDEMRSQEIELVHCSDPRDLPSWPTVMLTAVLEVWPLLAVLVVLVACGVL